MSKEMVIFTRTYDLITWLFPLTEKFPRSQRFVLTQRLHNALLNFQELIIEANALRSQQRLAKINLADTELRKLRLYLRLSQRWGWLSDGQYRHVSAMIVEIGKLLGGWKKSVTYRA
jgi:four helix bundle protein